VLPIEAPVGNENSKREHERDRPSLLLTTPLEDLAPYSAGELNIGGTYPLEACRFLSTFGNFGQCTALSKTVLCIHGT
jgi:hypothetical protein